MCSGVTPRSARPATDSRRRKAANASRRIRLRARMRGCAVAGDDDPHRDPGLSEQCDHATAPEHLVIRMRRNDQRLTELDNGLGCAEGCAAVPAVGTSRLRCDHANGLHSAAELTGDASAKRPASVSAASGAGCRRYVDRSRTSRSIGCGFSRPRTPMDRSTSSMRVEADSLDGRPRHVDVGNHTLGGLVVQCHRTLAPKTPDP